MEDLNPWATEADQSQKPQIDAPSISPLHSTTEYQLPVAVDPLQMLLDTAPKEPSSSISAQIKPVKKAPSATKATVKTAIRAVAVEQEDPLSLSLLATADDPLNDNNVDSIIGSKMLESKQGDLPHVPLQNLSLNDPMSQRQSPTKFVDPLSPEATNDESADRSAAFAALERYSTTAGPSRSLGAYLSISISDPTVVSDIISSHTQYKITATRLSIHSNDPLLFTVSRRFNDFFQLHTHLKQTYPGCIIPPIPEKSSIGRFESEFIQHRQYLLERFLKNCARHPIVQSDTLFNNFLQQAHFHVDTQETKSIFSFFKSAPSTQSYLNIKDPDFEQDQIYLENLETQFRELFKILDSFISQRKLYARAMFEFGERFRDLSGLETRHPLIEKKLKVLGDIHIGMKDLLEKQVSVDFRHLVLVVEEYLRYINAANVGFIPFGYTVFTLLGSIR